MANNSKDHTSIRVHAPPGGHSNNIFGPSQDEQSAANKKKNTQSDIFGTKTDNVNPAPAKPSRNTGNNIFGTDPEESVQKASTIAGQYKQTQMKSNIFGPEEPSTTRHVSNKNQSNIFGIDDDQNKHQAGVRQGRRDPNASRMGYNPINGESYSTAPKVNETEKQPEPTAAESANTESAPKETNTNNEQAPANENDKPQETPATENNKSQATPTADNNNKTQATNDNAQKPVHTSVRVFHPPGGRSNGPLW